MANYRAIWCQDATIAYSMKSGEYPVLNMLNLTVERGTIYGLLGPSGCGKTTLLKCILGRLKLDHGRILVFGSDTPCQREGNEIPGRDVGYMPQDLALHSIFNIKETLHFYGKLNGMRKREVDLQIEFLNDLLQLPPGSKLIQELSGGQKRRVSFAATMLHNPRLLILDEPTVGVDPVLSAKIWRHLVYLSSNRGCTIMITTHYIEEARQANRVGLMRSGTLLCEGEPEVLIQMKGLSNLQEVFLELCGDESEQPMIHDSSSGDEEEPLCFDKYSQPALFNPNILDDDKDKLPFEKVPAEPTKTFNHLVKTSIINPLHLSACIMKECTNIMRTRALLLMYFILPFMQISAMLLCWGRYPKNIPVGIVNEDHFSKNFSLSELYISFLQQGNTMDLQNFESMREARKAADNAEIAAIVHFGPRYTSELLLRRINFEESTVETALKSSVYISLDETVKLTSMLLKEKFLDAYREFQLAMVLKSNHNPSLAILPINFTEPFYGKEVDSLTDYMTPGVILQLTYTLSASLTGIRSLVERKMGITDRLHASGVTETMLMLAAMIVQFFIMTGQVAILFFMALIVFDSPFLGNLGLAVGITYLQGLTGIAFGLIISAVCTEETQAIHLNVGTIYPILLLSGVIWPLDAIPYPVRYVSYLIPLTLPAVAMRDVFLRGWSIGRERVWQAVLINIAFIAAFVIIAITVRKILFNKR